MSGGHGEGGGREGATSSQAWIAQGRWCALPCYARDVCYDCISIIVLKSIQCVTCVCACVPHAWCPCCSHVLKKPNNKPRKRPRTWANALQMLDYRCHVPGGVIGTAYPPHVSGCWWQRVLLWGHVCGALWQLMLVHTNA